MDFNKAALEMHETHHGKVGIVSKVEVKTRDDLSTAYTPGVAEPCRKIKENPDDVYKYTFKGNMVAVVSNGTAVLDAALSALPPQAARLSARAPAQTRQRALVKIRFKRIPSCW